MQIPSYLERAIHEGRAQAKIYSGGLGMQMVLKVPTNSYIVIYGYYFRPYLPQYGDDINTTTGATPAYDTRALIQYVLFKTHNGFYPYAHNGQSPTVGLMGPGTYIGGTTSPQANARKYMPPVYHEPRSTYMVSNKDVGIAITFLNTNGVGTNTGTVTTNSETLPPNLQYGGQFMDIFFSGYYDPTLGSNYYPLQSPYSEQSGLPFFPDQYQLFTRANAGTIPPTTNSNSGGSMEAAKYPLITIMYVQFNEEMPQTLK